MPDLSALTLEQLERAVAIKREIEVLKSQLDNIEGDGAVVIPTKRGRKPKLQLTEVAAEEPKKKRKMSRAAKAKIGAAQKARWEKVRAEKGAAGAESKTTPLTLLLSKKNSK
jgi:hypothetical protein